jgi:hypothetical protein
VTGIAGRIGGATARARLARGERAVGRDIRRADGLAGLYRAGSSPAGTIVVPAISLSSLSGPCGA